MKILEEPLLLNDLKSTLDIALQEDEVLIKRPQAEPVIVMSLKLYNEWKAKLYHAYKGDEK